LKSLGNRKVPRLYDISAVRTRSGLTYDQLIVHFLVDEVVVTFEVGFIDVQARRDPEKTLYLMGTLNMLVGIQVMNWLEWIKLFIFHFVPSNPFSSSLRLDTPGSDAEGDASREPCGQGSRHVMPRRGNPRLFLPADPYEWGKRYNACGHSAPLEGRKIL
jgi:hypothetical protein